MGVGAGVGVGVTATAVGVGFEAICVEESADVSGENNPTTRKKANTPDTINLVFSLNRLLCHIR